MEENEHPHPQDEPPQINLPSSTESELPIPETEITQFEIAGFWRRGFAALIDGAILGVPCMILGFVFRNFAFSLGPWGRLIGYSLILLYWGYFNSRLGSGQTAGKRLMKLVVVNNKGEYLPVRKAVLRALVLVLIGLLNGWAVPFMQNPIAVIISGIVIFGGGLALLYGLLFNRKTRQGIHDLIVGSYVSKAPLTSETIAPEARRIHTQISYGLVILGLVLGFVGLAVQASKPTLGVLKPGEWEEIQELQTTLLESNEFFSVGVQRTNRWQMGTDREWEELSIQAWAKKLCTQEADHCGEEVKRIARTAFDHYDGIDSLTGMRIVVMNGFDLGLAYGNLSWRGEWTIDDWREQLEE